jgi:hypothetical protein
VARETLAETEARLVGVDAALTETVRGLEGQVASIADAARRIDELSRRVDELGDRVGAAELLLRERDQTDLELYLDRIEAFERLAAETDPDTFATRTDVDGLREELRAIARRVNGDD